MPLPPSILRALPRISGMQQTWLVKASTADGPHRNWMCWSGRQNEAHDQKHFLPNPGSKTTGRRTASSGSFFTRLSRARVGDSKERRSASVTTSARVELTAPKYYRGVQTQIAFRWNYSRRFNGQSDC